MGQVQLGNHTEFVKSTFCARTLYSCLHTVIEIPYKILCSLIELSIIIPLRADYDKEKIKDSSNLVVRNEHHACMNLWCN